MSLRDATPSPGLPPGPPYACADLGPWAGVDFTLPAGDDRLPALHAGGAETCPAHANLVGAATAWRDWPDSMDFLDPASPNAAIKALERDLYLARWERHLPPGIRALDLGGGIGRFATWLLDRGCDVDLVDPDLLALRRALGHAIGRPGRLDLHWSTAEALPSLGPYDVALAVEVLCYGENPALALANIRRTLRPGGTLLFSVEAALGWAMSVDVPAGTLPALLQDGVVHVPGDRFVRTFDEPRLRELFAAWEIVELVPTHYVLSGPLEGCAGALEFPALLDAEARIRAHPVLGRLNRAWMGVARAG